MTELALASRALETTKSQSRNWSRTLLIVLAWLIFALILLVPLGGLLWQGCAKGLGFIIESIQAPDALAALRLTLLVTAISLPLNVLFGLSTAWLITRFDFWGRTLLLSLIELPLSVSPVIAGLVYVLLFGSQSFLAPFLDRHDLQIIYATPGIVLATLFVTLPYVTRELINVMAHQGAQEEEAARSLGAGGWRIFFLITLPNIKWALLYGVVLVTSRALGEFGAVSVVSGHIQGVTNTLPLHIEALYNDYNITAAFSVSILLLLIALVIIMVRHWCERHIEASEQA